MTPSAPTPLDALRITASNIRSLGPAGALDGCKMEFREWLGMVEEAMRPDAAEVKLKDLSGDLKKLMYDWQTAYEPEYAQAAGDLSELLHRHFGPKWDRI